MAPIVFSLILLRDDSTEASLLSVLQKLPDSERPLFVGKCQHWIHAPQLSAESLLGTGSEVKSWGYVLVHKSKDPNVRGIPDAVRSLCKDTWSITAEGDDNLLANFHEAQRDRRAAPVPSLPEGWNPVDHSGLDAAIAPPDLEASLALSAHPLGSRTDGEQAPVILKDFVRNFGKQHTSAVCMLNLLSYMPDQRPRYLEYRAAFAASVGSRYGGKAMFASAGVYNWSSKAADMSDPTKGGWEDAALVHYPSIWHFGKMLDDPDYADADRRFKQGALRDNPILCCTEVYVEYEA